MSTKNGFRLLTVVCFLACVCIVLFFKDMPTVRGFMGDVIVTVLIYSFIRSFVWVKPVFLGIGVLLFAYLVEGLQYVHIVELLGLGKYPLARVVIGTTFSFSDLLAYTLGIFIILSVTFVENIIKTKRRDIK